MGEPNFGDSANGQQDDDETDNQNRYRVARGKFAGRGKESVHYAFFYAAALLFSAFYRHDSQKRGQQHNRIDKSQ